MASSITVVGSIAFDHIETPWGESPRALGGSATHFALSASHFADVLVVGPVGDDFGDGEYEVLRTRGTDTSDVEHVAGGKTFFWHGRYHEDVNHRDTITTELNVFETFQPKLSDASRASEVLFLANIQPDLQREVRAQSSARFVALDSMDLWINIARDSLVAAIGEVDLVILNDQEVKQLTEARSLAAGAREVLAMGPRFVIAKQGEYGAALFSAEGVFHLPAMPLDDVVDPTGAGDTFAGGVVGWIAAHGGDPDDATVRRAMAHGTALASFNVQGFGADRTVSVQRGEVDGRVAELEAMTRF